jgi:hypothetical protein
MWINVVCFLCWIIIRTSHAELVHNVINSYVSSLNDTSAETNQSVNWPQSGQPEFDYWQRQGCSFDTTSRSVLGPIYCPTQWVPKTRDSSVCIALGYGLDDWGSRVRFPAGAGNFSLYHRVQNNSGPTQPPIQWVPGALSLGVKRPGHEADHLPPSSAEAKNAWSYTSTPNTSSWHGA